MKLRRLTLASLLFVSAIPICAQTQSLSEVDSLLQGASKALDRWQQLAPGIHCEDATQIQLRDDCKNNVLSMGERVQEAKTQIVLYRQLSTPQPVDLFDAYQSFRRVMEIAENMNCAPYGFRERTRRAFAETYNAFVKVNDWFGGVVRTAIQDAPKSSGHAF
jgi:hypothetical protein